MTQISVEAAAKFAELKARLIDASNSGNPYESLQAQLAVVSATFEGMASALEGTYGYLIELEGRIKSIEVDVVSWGLRKGPTGQNN